MSETAEDSAPGSPDASWEQRLAVTWQSLEMQSAPDFVCRIEALASELPADSPVGLFESGSAQDSTGRPDLAVPLYRAALAAGLGGLRRRRAVIQLASSLRNLGQAHESVALLSAEASAPQDELSSAVSAFLALALVDVGREGEAVGVSLQALSRHLPRYNASLARYALELVPSAERRTGAAVAAVLIHVSDAEAGLAWYAEAFPKAVREVVGPERFSRLSLDGIAIEVVPSDDKVSSGAAGSVVYWRVDSFESALARLLGAGATLYRGPLRIEDDQSMCQVRDPWGNCIGLRGPRDTRGGSDGPGNEGTG